MATAREILAGKAAVEIALRDKLKAGLDAAQGRLRRFAVEVAAIGIGFDTVANIASRAMSIISNVFTGPAAQIQDLADRTGLSVQVLQVLGEVAAETGAGLEDVQTAARGMANFLGAAETAGSDAADTLTEFGLSLDQLKGRSPDEQMMTLANALASIEDPTKKAELASKIFGRAAQRLIPLLSMGEAGIAAYRKQLEEAGVIRTPEQIAIADKIGEAWDRALRRLKAAGFSALSAVAPALDSLAAAAVGVAEAFNKWVANNPALAKTLAVVLGLVIAGAVALATFTGVMLAASMVASALATAWSVATAAAGAFTAVMGLAMSPIGIVVAAVAATIALLGALTAAFLAFTDSGQAMWSGFVNSLSAVWQTTVATVGGILDALSAGNFQLAGQIAMAGLNLAFVAGLSSIKLFWVNTLNSMLAAMADFVSRITGKMDGLAGAIAGMMAALGMSGGAEGLAKSLKVLNKVAGKGLGKIAIDAKDDIENAAQELDGLLKQAADERAARESALKVPKGGPDGADEQQKQDIATAAKKQAEFTMGTFSARMAGNFAQRRSEQVWDAIQAADERAADALEELNDKIKGGRLVVVP